MNSIFFSKVFRILSLILLVFAFGVGCSSAPSGADDAGTDDGNSDTGSDGDDGGNDGGNGGNDGVGGGDIVDNQVSCDTPSGLTRVDVDSASELADAVIALESNTELVLAAGTYTLSGDLYLAQNISNVVVRGATGDREDVIIDGTNSVDFAFWAMNIDDLYVTDLTIRDAAKHNIILNGGTDHVEICNVHLINSGEQFIKANPGNGGVTNGLVRGCIFEFEDGISSTYSNGVDIYDGADWVIQDSLFRNFMAASGGAMGPAVLAWAGTTNTIVERNLFINCDRGISLGLVDAAGNDHSGGIIRNNIIYREDGVANFPDVGIMVADSPNTKVLNNTVYQNGTYANAIEYRFTASSNVVIRNNLLDGNIQLRDGTPGTVENNISDAAANWFVNPGAADLHLTAAATDAIDQATTEADVGSDYDGDDRPKGSAPDIGADER